VRQFRQSWLALPTLSIVLAFGDSSSVAQCDATGFWRGDADCSGERALTDAVVVFDWLFRGGATLPCLDSADADDDGRVTITDGVAILLHLFEAPSLPARRTTRDATPDALGCVSGRAPCPFELRPERLGQIERGALTQPSGVAVGWRNPDLLWLGNDFDGEQSPIVFAVDRSGQLVGMLTLCASEAQCPPEPSRECLEPMERMNCDWEAMTIGPAPDGSPALYVGDIGGNRFASRTVFAIHRVPEPAMDPGGDLRLLRDAGDFATLFFSFEPRGFDAEALLCDPVTGDLFVVSHLPTPALFRYPSPQRPGEIVGLERIADLPPFEPAGSWISGAEISPSGERLLVKTFWAFASWVYLLPGNGDDPAAACAAEPICAWNLAEYLGAVSLHAGAIAFLAEDEFVSIEENAAAQIFRLEIATR